MKLKPKPTLMLISLGRRKLKNKVFSKDFSVGSSDEKDKK